jgi:hypothetical protein
MLEWRERCPMLPDALMHDLNLPRREEHELLVDRDRVCKPNGEDSRALADVDTFRVVAEQEPRHRARYPHR